MPRITLNGEPHTTSATTVAELLALEVTVSAGHAVARNGEVVRAGSHAEAVIEDGDVVEIVTAVQGG